MDHIDGNRQNNNRENLRLLCPNCHSQTETYCGKNVNNGRVKVTDDELWEIYSNTQSIHQTLLKVGLAAKGGNYKRMYNLIERWRGNFPEALTVKFGEALTGNTEPSLIEEGVETRRRFPKE